VRPWAVVLAGGRGTRLGRSKWTLHLGGRSLLRQTVERLQEVAEGVVVVVAPGTPLLDLPSGTLQAEDEAPGRGPLMGLAVGLGRVAQEGGEWAWAVGCDAPLLDPALLRRLAEQVGEGVDAVVPRVEGRAQPLHALYRVRCAGTARALLAIGRASLHALLDIVRVRFVEPLPGEEPAWARSCFSVNTPADLLRLEAWQGTTPPTEVR